jgi:hypothetical protein
MTSFDPMILTSKSNPEKIDEAESLKEESTVLIASMACSSLELPIAPKNSISRGVVSTDWE